MVTPDDTAPPAAAQRVDPDPSLGLSAPPLSPMALNSQQESSTIVPEGFDVIAWPRSAKNDVKNAYVTMGTEHYASLINQGKAAVDATVETCSFFKSGVPEGWDMSNDRKRRSNIRDEIKRSVTSKKGRWLKAEIEEKRVSFSLLSDSVIDQKIIQALSRKKKPSRKRNRGESGFSVDDIPHATVDIGPGEAPTPLSFSGTSEQKVLICEAFAKVGVESPRPYQLEAVWSLVFGDATSMALVRQTGEGKSAVILAASHLLNQGQGITIILYPLQALGIDQESKAQRQGIKGAIDVDLLDASQLQKLASKLYAIETFVPRDPLILMMTVDSIKKIRGALLKVIERGLVNFVCFDELHAYSRDGRTYRPVFLDVKELILDKIFSGSPATKFLGTTATCTLEVFNDVQEITGIKFDHVQWGSMARRKIFLSAEVEGEQTHRNRMGNIIKSFLGKNPTKKALLYTNFASKAEGPLLEYCEDIHDELAEKHATFLNTEVRTLVGSEGLMMKVDTINFFSECIEPVESHEMVDNNLHINKVCQILVATSAANAGVSSDYVALGVRDGFPSSLYDAVQEWGRLLRRIFPGEEGFVHRFHFVLSVSSLAALFQRIYSDTAVEDPRTPREDVLARELGDLRAVLRLLVTTRACYHAAFENVFSCPEELAQRPFVVVDDPGGRGPCDCSCSNCMGQRDSIFPKVNRFALMDILEKASRDSPNMTLRDLCVHLNDDDNKKVIWDAQVKPDSRSTNAIILQLFAAGILKEHVRKNKHSKTPIIGRRLATEQDENAPSGESLVWKNDSSWAGIDYDE